MPCFNTTMMGVAKGVLDYYGIKISTPMLFGLSGHAFLMNIHPELCPSGPYCWKQEKVGNLLKNLGVEMIDSGYFSKESTQAERDRIEELVKENLNKGIPCSLLNMEHQLIYGYDDTGLLTAQPWLPKVDFPPGHLTYRTWAELGDEIHLSFYLFHKCHPKDEIQAIKDSLKYAIDLYRKPTSYTDMPFAVADGAYNNWIDGVNKGYGASQGNWWNGIVWSECRNNAAAYFEEISLKYLQVSLLADQLKTDYQVIAQNIHQASDKTLNNEKKVKTLQLARDKEGNCIGRIEELLRKL